MLNIKTMKIVSFFILTLLLTVGISGCSKEKFDPTDTVTSIFSGDYGNSGLWDLVVTVNGEQIENHGYVRFDSKLMKEGNFKFIDVIPGESTKEFKNVPLVETDKGMSFKIEYSQSDKPIVITGLIILGKMTVDISF